jgi:hypothetical protein
VMGDYDKSKQMFDAAIELDSMYPSAWLGKAFVEIAKVDDDHFNSLEIDEYLNRALRSNSDITAYKVALAGCLAYRHAVLIKKYVQAVETAMEEQKKAKQKAMTGLVVAAAGTMFTGGNKSITSNIVGGALIGGGVTTAISSGLKSMELEKLGNSIYSAALGQTYLSIPIIRLCESLTGSNIDNDLKHNFNTVVDSWKDSTLYLLDRQLQNMIKPIKKWNQTGGNDMTKFPKKEIDEFKILIAVVGLNSSELNQLINDYIDLINVLNDKELHYKKENKLKSRLPFIIIFVLSIPIILFLVRVIKLSPLLSIIISSTSAIIIAVIVDNIITPAELKEMRRKKHTAFSKIEAIKLNKIDFNFIVN